MPIYVSPLVLQTYSPTVDWDGTVQLGLTYHPTEIEIWDTVAGAIGQERAEPRMRATKLRAQHIFRPVPGLGGSVTETHGSRRGLCIFRPCGLEFAEWAISLTQVAQTWQCSWGGRGRPPRTGGAPYKAPVSCIT